MSDLTSWDPLESGIDKDLQANALRSQIRQVLLSYTGWYDPFSELIQNALDAVDKRAFSEGTDFTPTIWITIDLTQNRFSVTDNGIGFSEQQFRAFLAPNISFKDSDSNRGNKGVGATYLAYGYNYLQLGTKTPDFQFVGTLKDGRNWVDGKAEAQYRPVINKSVPLDSVYLDIDRGSTFSLEFIGDNIRPKDLSWLGLSTANQWSALLRAKTPLGGIYLSLPKSRVSCEIMVIDREGAKTISNLDNCEYIYPHEYVATVKDLDELLKKQKDIADSEHPSSKLPSSFTNLNGIYRFLNADTLLRAYGKSLDPKETELVKQYNIFCYGFFCYSTGIWDRINTDGLGLSERGKVVGSGLQLAANRMPQGERKQIELTRSIGYQRNAQVVCHFTNANPDLGRKGFQPELVGVAQKLATLIVQQFIRFREFLREDTGVPPNIQEEIQVDTWIQSQRDHARLNPLRITRKGVFLPTEEPSITSLPQNEQDVISLFNQLLAGGVIRSIRLMSTSQHNQYDGVFYFCTRNPLEHYHFNVESNPLGVKEDVAVEAIEAPPKILEYKFCVDSLIEDFEKGIKSEHNVVLVVAWQMGSESKKYFDITPLLHLSNLQNRIWHGVTHVGKRSTGGTHVTYFVILSELINYINDPSGQQEYQRETYLNETDAL